METAMKGFVSGVVQGVGYRAFVKRHAIRLGVSGTATNLADGRVEVVLQGSSEKVESLQHLVASGPILAKVTSLSWELIEVQNQEGFVIR